MQELPMIGRVVALIAMTLMMGCTAPQQGPGTDVDATAWFLGVTNFSDFSQTNRTSDSTVALLSPEIAAPFPFDELVVSWNATAPVGSGIKIEARASSGERTTQYYTLGLWSPDTTRRVRESVTGQRDEDGDVKTDTLALKRPADRVQLRVTLFPDEKDAPPALKFIGLCFSRPGPIQSGTNSDTAIRESRVLPVPEAAQLAYPGGDEWGSPTCVSMVLGYWAQKLKRPDLALDVPEVAAAVFDRNWPGTGNWPFNTAFAGQFTGMRAYVTRLQDTSELEALIAAGVPPILSVSFDFLNGRATDQGGGHLVVCAGFNERGDLVLNDPWAFGEKAGTVPRTVSRRDVQKAWVHSRHTVYVIHPESWAIPKSRWSHW